MRKFGSYVRLSSLFVEEADFSEVRTLTLYGSASLPAGVDLSGLTTLELSGNASLPAGVNLSGLTTLSLYGSASLPAGVDLSGLTMLSLYGSASLPAGVDLSGLTMLSLYGSASLPAGVDLSGLTTLELSGNASLPAGVNLSGLTTLSLYGSASLPAGVKLSSSLLADVPVLEQIDARILGALAVEGSTLDMGSWHSESCAMTHCRAGWAIHLCGEAGYALEGKHGAQVAGALIYAKSRPDKATPNFLASNQEALDDLRANT